MIISEDSRWSPKSSKESRSLPKMSEVPVSVQMWTRSQCFSLPKSEIARKVSSFIHFTHGFRSLHGSELTYFWKLCEARRQQLTALFNQAWEIGPQAWVVFNPQAWDSRLRRESWQVYNNNNKLIILCLVLILKH